MWWVGLLEEGTWQIDQTKRIVNNEHFSWQETDEYFPNDSPLWSDGTPSYTESFPLAGLLLPSGFLTDVPSSNSSMAINKLVFPICKLGRIYLLPFSSTYFIFLFLPPGLSCTSKTITGPENCECMGTLCYEDEFCVMETGLATCYPRCKEFPSLTTQPCTCSSTDLFSSKVCYAGQACGYSSGCWTVPTCPDLPLTAGQEGCICDSLTSTSVCWPGKVCAHESTKTEPVCRDMPPACLPMPSLVEHSEGCYCDASKSICSIGEMCDDISSSCSLPPTCEHPSKLGLSVSVEFDEDHIFIFKDELTFVCHMYHSVSEIKVFQ